jgi:thiol-disulfide isomerase/thioredoxin
MITAKDVVTALLHATVALCLLAPPSAHSAGALEPWTGGATPALILKNLAGEEIRLDAFRGRTVIVNFWATWCAPCVAEMPSLQRLRDRMAPDGIEVIAVNLQENAGRIRPFVERLDITFPVVRDHDGSVRSAWGVSVFPTSFVVGPDQHIAWWVKGEIDWGDVRVELRLRSLR